MKNFNQEQSQDFSKLDFILMITVILSQRPSKVREFSENWSILNSFPVSLRKWRILTSRQNYAENDDFELLSDFDFCSCLTWRIFVCRCSGVVRHALSFLDLLKSFSTNSSKNSRRKIDFCRNFCSELCFVKLLEKWRKITQKRSISSERAAWTES